MRSEVANEVVKNSTYWNKYYDKKTQVSAPLVPSQFAAFILSELNGIDTQIVDFGCGNGRDSLFFARHGFETLGVDGSESAIASCRSHDVQGANFLCSSVTNDELPSLVENALSGNSEDITVYARFFLHAIDSNAQTKFLRACRKVLNGKGRAVFEFRTDRDQGQAKITPDHYRRFVNPLQFMNEVASEGFKVCYFVEGFGFAKYREDDAHVCRFILEPVE